MTHCGDETGRNPAPQHLLLPHDVLSSCRQTDPGRLAGVIIIGGGCLREPMFERSMMARIPSRTFSRLNASYRARERSGAPRAKQVVVLRNHANIGRFSAVQAAGKQLGARQHMRRRRDRTRCHGIRPLCEWRADRDTEAAGERRAA
jgi:hypothetical protein